MRRSSVVTAGATLVVASLLGPPIADAAGRDNPRAEREQVRARQAQVAANLNADKASISEIRDALQTLQANVAAQERSLRRAEDAVGAAEEREARANAAVKRLAKERKALSKLMARRAVSAYVAPPSDDVLSLLESSSMSEASSRHLYIELRALSDSDLEDKLSGVDDDMQYQRRRAIEAREQAQDKRAEQATKTEEVKEARAQQQQLAGSVQKRIDDSVAEAASLGARDRELSARIAREQALLYARLAQQREEARRAREAAAEKARQEKAAADAAAARAAAATTTTGRSTSTTGRSTSTSAGTSTSARRSTTTGSPVRSDGSESAPAVSVGSSYSSGGLSLTTVGGITVSSSIAGNVRSLLSAASASGLHLSGGGYRDPSQQINLRRSHCGSSDYAIYSMPSSQCSPPTAPPGQSQHEVGLAIDFDNCSSRSTACYQWLAGNASRFGFYNLPSEPWHWSVNGH